MSMVATAAVPAGAARVVDALAQALAEVAVATAKAQDFHWNVTGMAFGPLHALFQTVYEDHFAAQDELAERAKALGAGVDGRMSAHLALSAVAERAAGSLSPEGMVAELAADQRTISATLRALAVLAEEAGDPATNDLAVERVAAHDKFAWMLAAHLR